MPTIGLFGTCGNKTQSSWRDDFIALYEYMGFSYFNPWKEDWKPENAAEEAYHLSTDEVILFPITASTYGLGSLSEIGFSVLNAIQMNNKRDFVVFIDDCLDPTLDDISLRVESLRTRALVKEHLLQLEIDGLYIVDSLEEMKEVSIKLYQIAKLRAEIKSYLA